MFLELIGYSLHIRESKTVLDSGFYTVSSGFPVLDSRILVNGNWKRCLLKKSYQQLQCPLVYSRFVGSSCLVVGGEGKVFFAVLGDHNLVSIDSCSKFRCM